VSKDFEKGLKPPNKKLPVVLTPESLFLLFFAEKNHGLENIPSVPPVHTFAIIVALSAFKSILIEHNSRVVVQFN
jgi:hypothetical protein